MRASGLDDGGHGPEWHSPGGTPRMAKNSRDSGSSPDPDGIVEAAIADRVIGRFIQRLSWLKLGTCGILKVTASRLVN